MPRIAIPILLLALVACEGEPRNVVRIDRIERGLTPVVVVAGETPEASTIDERIKFHRAAGVSIAVINSGRIDIARSYGLADASLRTRLAPQTLFQAGSVSKPFAALVALRLVEDGTLSLDEDVNRYLKSWKIAPKDGRVVTLRDLLSHTAGVTVPSFYGYSRGEDAPTLRQILDGKTPAQNHPVEIDPPTEGRYRYSGGGYVILQQLLEDVSGLPFERLAAQAVFEPLRLASSGYRQPLLPQPGEEIASGHSLVCPENACEATPIDGGWRVYPELAAAGLWTTPSDIAVMLIEIMRAWRGESGAFLRQDTVRQMLSSQSEDDTRWGGRFGLGMLVENVGGRFSFHHSGSNEGFITYFRAFPEFDQGYVVMMNALPETGGALIDEIELSIAREYDMPRAEMPPRETIKLPASALDRHVGSYRFEEWPDLSAQVRIEGERLLLDLPWLGESILWPTSANRFFLTTTRSFEIEFEGPEFGPSSGFRYWQSGSETRTVRVEP